MATGSPVAHFERKYDVYINGRVWHKGKLKWQAMTKNPNGYVKVQPSLNGVKK